MRIYRSCKFCDKVSNRVTYANACWSCKVHFGTTLNSTRQLLSANRENSLSLRWRGSGTFRSSNCDFRPGWADAGRNGRRNVADSPRWRRVVVAVAKGWSSQTGSRMALSTKYISPTRKSSRRNPHRRAKQMQLRVGTRSSPVTFILPRARLAATFRKSPCIQACW